MRNWIAAALLVLGMVAPAAAEVGVTGVYNVYDSGRAKATEGVALRAGGKVYGWASYEETNVQGVGQNVYRLNMVGGGLGFRQELTPRWRLFAEFGYFDPMEKERQENVAREFAIHAFQTQFGSPPFPVRYHELELKADYGFRFGAEWQAREHVAAHIGFRALSVDEHIDISSRPAEERAFDCGCWWQRRDPLGLSSYEIGITARF